MSTDCPNCSALQNKVSQLIGGIAGTLGTIEAELEEQTMSRQQLVQVIKDRLYSVLSGAY